MKRSNLPRDVAHRAGFSLVELMVALVIASLVLIGLIEFFVGYQRVTRQQEQVIAVQTSLRAASDRVTSNLRRADFGVPSTLLATWVDWVSGLTTNPRLTVGANATTPDSLTVAACTGVPIATVASNLAMGTGNTTLSLTSAIPGQTIAQLLDTTNRKLIRLVAGASADRGFARVTAISGSTVTIDTDPGLSGNQGFASRTYFAGTPVCRVDVTTYTVNTASRALTIDRHQGAGPQLAFDGLTNFKVGVAGARYRVAFTARTEQVDPQTGNPIVRALSSDVALRNN